MIIIPEYPPNWEKIKSAFPVENAEICIAYGDTIYNPYKLPLRDDVIHHEEVHMRQQNGKPDEWFERYMADPLWRVEQEAYAYGQQLKYIRDRRPPGVGERKIAVALDSFARFLSGPVYGNVISKSKAQEMIRKASRQ
jgi:hypothetical protein